MTKIKSTEGSSAYLGYKPNKLVPESEKTDTWLKAMADWIIETTSGLADTHEDVYSMFNGVRDNEQLNYITKTFGVEFPAKIKHIPLIRPKLNYLIGEEQERGVEFNLFSQDTESIQERKQELFNYILRRYIQLQRGEITEDEFAKEEKHLRRGFKTGKEIAVYHMIKDYIFKHRLHEEFSDSFINKIVTGEEKGRVRLPRVGEDPIFEPIPPQELHYAPNAVKWISDCDWCVRRRKLTVTEILDAYGEDLSYDEREELFQQREHYGRSVKISNSYNMDTALNDINDIDTDALWGDDTYDVYEGEFKSVREIMVYRSPNKRDPENPFIKIIGDEEYETMPNSRKKNVSKRYVEDLYRFTRIGEDKYAKYGKIKLAERDKTRPSKVSLTFEGLTHAGPIKPYSLVKQTWDIQMLYDIMHFHKENLIAMSGTKGNMMDLAMMPDFGYGNASEDGFSKNMQMFLYYKKMGTMWVDSRKRDVNNTFNQLSNYDDTLGAGLQVVLAVIQHLEHTAGQVINMNRQRVGQVESRDGMGANQAAMDQSSLGTEPIFNEHDDFKDRILTKILNLSTISYKDGKEGAYTDESFDQYMYTITPEYTLSDYNIYISNRMNNKRTVEQLKVAAQQYAAQGLIPFEHVIDLLTTGSLKEMQTKLKESIAEQQEKIALQQQQQAEFEQQLAATQNQMEQARLQVEVEKIRADIATQQAELALKEEEVDNEKRFKDASLALDAKRVDLEALQLKLDPGSAAAEVRND